MRWAWRWAATCWRRSRAIRTTSPTRTRSTSTSGLGEEEGSDYELDGDAFDEAADQAGHNAPQVVAPTGSEIDEFRAGLEAHWGGNLPALWAYLDSIDPAGGDNPEPPGEGAAPYWEPDDDYDEFGNVIETAEEERERWRARVEQKLRQLSQSY